MIPPFEDPKDAQLRAWLERYGPPQLSTDLHFDTGRWVRDTIPRRLAPRPRWGWSVVAAVLFLGIAGGGAWLVHGRPPQSLANHLSTSTPTTVKTAEAWLRARTTIPVAAPGWMPPQPSDRPILAATARVTHPSGASGTQGWTVSLYTTRRPRSLNSPQLVGQSPWLTWSRQTVSATALTAQQSLTLLEGHNPVIGNQGLQVMVPPQTPITLGHGVRGEIETGGTVVWHQGTVIGIVVGTQTTHDVQVARVVVTSIAQHERPSHPTLIALAGNQTQAHFGGTWGSVDWISGHTVTVINGKALPPTTLWRMADSWPTGD